MALLIDQELLKCPICNSIEFEPHTYKSFIINKDNNSLDENTSRTVLQCINCGSFYNNDIDNKLNKNN